MMQNNNRIDTTLLGYFLPQGKDPTLHLKKLARDVADIDRIFKPSAQNEETSETFFNLMINNYFLPTPPILFHGCDPHPCFFVNTVLKPSDDFDAIFSCLKKTSIYLQHDIQTAIDFSDLRASRTQIAMGKRQSLGPVRFMELFEHAPQRAYQKTPMRFYLSADHQDVEDYLSYIERSKENLRFAIGVSNEFLRAAFAQTDYSLYHKKAGEVAKSIPARPLLDKIINLLQKDIPLDIIFTDTLQSYSAHQLPDKEVLLSAQNQLMFPSELMASGTVNLVSLMSDNKLDEPLLEKIIYDALHFLDNCFEKNTYPDEESKTVTKASRRIALTVLGLGEVCATLNPENNMRKSYRLCAEIANLVQQKAIMASHRLGEERGFKNQINFDGRLHKTRNSQLLSQLHNPLLSQIANIPAYLFKKTMSIADYSELLPLHEAFQKSITNVASLKWPLKNVEANVIESLIRRTHELGLMSFEILPAST